MDYWIDILPAFYLLFRSFIPPTFLGRQIKWSSFPTKQWPGGCFTERCSPLLVQSIWLPNLGTYLGRLGACLLRVRQGLVYNQLTSYCKAATSSNT